MDLKLKIESFISSEKIAVVGVSSKSKFGNLIFKHMKEQNYNVIPVNKKLDTFEGEKCYSSIQEIENCDAVIVVVNKKTSQDVAEETVKSGIKKIWFQNGTAAKQTIEYCANNDLMVIDNECIFLHIEPVKGIHAFHRWINKLFGKHAA